MRQKTLILCLVLVLLISACGKQPEAATPAGDTELSPTVVTPNEVVEETEALAYPEPATTESIAETAYPAPDTSVVTNPYPAPGSGTSGSSPYPSPDQATGNNLESPMNPISGEETMTKGPVYLDTNEVKVIEGNPAQAGLLLIGSLPTPCNYLRVTMTPPDVENKIAIEVYSLADPAGVCIQVLQPFETTVNLGSFAAGNYTIWVNGTQVGEYTQ